MSPESPEVVRPIATDELLPFLSRPDLRRLWAAARERLERLGGVRGTLRLPAASEEERRAVAALLGLAKLPPGDLRVPLEKLDRALLESRFLIDLETALALLDGPLRDLPGEREHELQRQREMWHEAASHPAVRRCPELSDWLTELRATGLLRRLAAGNDERRLLTQALAVLNELVEPHGEVRLPVLAGRILGSSHALDGATPRASMVLRALARIQKQAPPKGALERRKVWEMAGVIADDLSCDVLVLGLRPLADSAIGVALRSLAEAGEPARITLRQLAGGEIRIAADTRIHLCENPVVVAAAANHWGARSSPLLCVGGFANSAVRSLLFQLARTGSTFAYHGDFDWAGLKIANQIGRWFPLVPWRFTAADYRDAVCSGGDRPSLHGRTVIADWDSDLAPAMFDLGLAVEEETVLDSLLEDLGGG